MLADCFLEVMKVFEKRVERPFHSASPVAVEIMYLFLIRTPVGGKCSICCYKSGMCRVIQKGSFVVLSVAKFSFLYNFIVIAVIRITAQNDKG